MSKLLEHIEISKFKNFVEKEFPKTPFYDFEITSVDFNSNENSPELKISINHYNPDSEICFLFKDFTYYFVTNESYQPWFISKSILNISFFEISKSNSNKNDLNLKDYLETDLEHGEIFKFRIIARNFMVDIFTSVIPEITIN